MHKIFFKLYFKLNTVEKTIFCKKSSKIFLVTFAILLIWLTIQPRLKDEPEHCDGYFGIKTRTNLKTNNLENNHLKPNSYEHASIKDHEIYYQS